MNSVLFQLRAEFPHGVLPEVFGVVTAAAPQELHGYGNFELLEKPATVFLCSTACPGDKILEAYEWTHHQCDTGSTVISGFHTPVAKDVLAIFARRGASLIWACSCWVADGFGVAGAGEVSQSVAA